MKGAVTVRVEGLRELDVQLGRLKRATAAAALTRAGRKSFEPMAALARSLAPWRSGRLADSIIVSDAAQGAGKARGAAEFAAVMKSGGSRAAAGRARSQARSAALASGEAAFVELFMGPRLARPGDSGIARLTYSNAFWQEFGTVDMAANPYMRPAWDRDARSMLTRLTAELRREIDRTVARAAKAGRLVG